MYLYLQKNYNYNFIKVGLISGIGLAIFFIIILALGFLFRSYIKSKKVKFLFI